MDAWSATQTPAISAGNRGQAHVHGADERAVTSCSLPQPCAQDVTLGHIRRNRTRRARWNRMHGIVPSLRLRTQPHGPACRRRRDESSRRRCVAGNHYGSSQFPAPVMSSVSVLTLSVHVHRTPFATIINTNQHLREKTDAFKYSFVFAHTRGYRCGTLSPFSWSCSRGTMGGGCSRKTTLQPHTYVMHT